MTAADRDPRTSGPVPGAGEPFDVLQVDQDDVLADFVDVPVYTADQLRAAVDSERDAVVAWLRESARLHARPGSSAAYLYADVIARNEHRTGGT